MQTAGPYLYAHYASFIPIDLMVLSRGGQIASITASVVVLLLLLALVVTVIVYFRQKRRPEIVTSFEIQSNEYEGMEHNAFSITV